MVLSLAPARIRFTVWTSSTELDVRPSALYVSVAPASADTMRPPDEYPGHTITPPGPSMPELEDQGPTWEDAEWQ
jgi:hypothetical protein